MKIILRKDVQSLGLMGEIVTVKNGYARNYLIPRNLAYFANEGALKALEIEKKRFAKIQAADWIFIAFSVSSGFWSGESWSWSFSRRSSLLV